MSDQNNSNFNLGLFYGGVNCFNQCVTDYSVDTPSETEKECFESCNNQIAEFFNQAPALVYSSQEPSS
jgi:hypothetical protein